MKQRSFLSYFGGVMVLGFGIAAMLVILAEMLGFIKVKP